MRRGFTLLELLTVVAILAMLFALVLPALSGAHGHANRAECMSNLKQMGLALHMYAQDHEEAFPLPPGGGVVVARVRVPGVAAPGDGAAALGMLVDKYIAEPPLLACESDFRRQEDWARRNDLPVPPRPSTSTVDAYPGKRKLTPALCSYAYDPTHSARHGGGVAIAADKTGNHTDGPVNSPAGANVLYIDGHVSWSNHPASAGAGADDIFRPGYQGDDPVTKRDARLHSYLVP